MTVIAEKLYDSRMHFVMRSEDGSDAHVDGSPHAGGEGKGMRPMELVLGALITCSAMDLFAMLEKQNMAPRTFRIECTSKRREGKPSTPFTDIHVVYILSGPVDEKRASVSAKLSLEKYCSVAEMLRPTVDITHEVRVVNE